MATAAPTGESSAGLPAVAWGRILLPAGLAVALLVVFANEYGYHRDELYFRMLPPAWGYVDQPPLTPLLARLTTLVADEPWALRIPATIGFALTVLIAALIAREMGGRGGAQALAAWGVAFGTFTLSMGHVFLTASLDFPLWAFVVLCVIQAQRRSQPWRWLLAGVVVGLGLENKLLVAVLLAALALGIAVAGPWRLLRSWWVWGAVAAVVVFGLPQLLYQALNGWPQLEMGAALAAERSGVDRWLMWPMLFVLLGPLLTPVWVAGLVWLVRRSDWRDVRFIAPAFVFVLLGVWAMGTQFYYPVGMLVPVYAIGCVPTAAWARTKWRTALLVAAVAATAASSVFELPVEPIAVVGKTPLPKMNQLLADQIGWPEYADQVAAAVTAHHAQVAIADNYGTAGAMARFRPEVTTVSGHNALADVGPPPDTTRVVIVGKQGERLASSFDSCEQVGVLQSQWHASNEEDGRALTLCVGPREPWSVLWPRFRHLD